ncbi:MAG: hypothetical protein ACKVZ0_18655 [Gemmatimonadales bacterium]
MRSLAGAVILSLLAGPVAAQHLRDRVRELFAFGTCGRQLCLDGSVTAANGHGDHFLPELIAGNSSLIGFVSDAVGSAAASAPLSATGSGVTYRFVGGLPVKVTESSGPILAERAQTLGKGRFFLGANLTSASFKRIRGVPLDGLEFNFAHQDVGAAGLGDPPLENDILEVRMQLNLKMQVTTLFATVGVTDGIDFSIAVPVVHTSLQGRSQAQIYPFGSTALHFFNGTTAAPGLRASTATFGSATGLGDVAVRVKANLRSEESFAVALLGDARLPTGDERDLLGAGSASFRGLGIISARIGDFRPHLNVGGLIRGGAGNTDAVAMTVGFEQPMATWATVVVDLLGEWQLGDGGRRLPEPTVYQFPFLRTVQPTNIPTTGDDRLAGSVGFKFRMNRGPTFVTNALVPLGRGGLQPTVTLTAGLEYGF